MGARDGVQVGSNLGVRRKKPAKRSGWHVRTREHTALDCFICNLSRSNEINKRWREVYSTILKFETFKFPVCIAKVLLY